MKVLLSIEIQGERLLLHPSKAVFWEAASTLLLADLHLGKDTHFRKQGLAVPAQILESNLLKLAHLISELKPQQVVFLGDLFHSTYNQAWLMFCDFLTTFPDISFQLVMGNHDILEDEHYQGGALQIHREELILEPFVLTHHPLENKTGSGYNLAGHIHPSVRLRGEGRQLLKLPCFYFGEKGGILPAFGEFTGTAVIYPKAGDRVFVIGDGKVLKVPT